MHAGCARRALATARSAPAISVLVITSRSARIACLRASADQARVLGAAAASTTVTTASTWNPRQRAVAGEGLQDRAGIGQTAGLDDDAPEVRHAPRSRSATSVRSAPCRSVRVVQHTQPLPSSTVSSVEPHQRVVDADRAELVDHDRGAVASGVVRKSRTSVVLPAPRNPVTTVTGSALRAPASAAARTGRCRGGREELVHPLIRPSVRSDPFPPADARTVKALPCVYGLPACAGRTRRPQKSISRLYRPPLKRSTV